MENKKLKRMTLGQAMGLGKEAAGKGGLPVGDIFGQALSGTLGFMSELEKPTGIVGGMDGPGM